VREHPLDHDQLFDRGDGFQLAATLAILDAADATLSNGGNWPV
jgi:hypothetical protein